MEEIKNLNEAFKVYNLNDDPDISKKIIDNILSRLLDNQFQINELNSVVKEGVSFDDILNSFKEAYRETDYYKVHDSIIQGKDYYVGKYPVPVGNIVVETNNVLDVVKYFVLGIKSRNTITISQTEYNDSSLSNMMLIIFGEAISKFGLDKNMLQILPFEDCFYEYYDEVIEIENSDEVLKQKPFVEKYIIYDNDGSFKENIEQEAKLLKEKNKEYEIIDGSLDEVITYINNIRPIGTSIFTQESDIAYQFVNLTHSPNTFVNSSLLNAEDEIEKKNKLYFIKKVMFPSGKDFDLEKYLKEYETL